MRLQAEMQRKYLPKLRFPEFQEEDGWGSQFGNDVFDQINNKNHDSTLPVLAITQDRGAIPRDQIDFHISVAKSSIENYKVVDVGDFIISLRTFQGGIEYSTYRGICSPAYVILRKKTSVSEMFFKHYFKTDRFIQQLQNNLEGIRDGKLVSYDEFSKLLLPTPSINEQQKIADSLNSLDELIEAQNQELNLLKAHKKGLMQHLFPDEGETVPRLRFPGFRGAKKWELMKLDELGQTLNGLVGKTASDFGSGKLFVTYKQVFDRAWIEFKECSRVNVGEDENQNELQLGDVLFTTSSETPKEVGFASVILSSPPEPLYLNSFCFALRPFDLDKLKPHFSRYLFRSPIYRRTVQILAQGSIRYNISKSAFLKLRLPVPSEEEQQKIADCLSCLDDVITSQNKKLDTLKDHKKGFMQQLFPLPEEVHE